MVERMAGREKKEREGAERASSEEFGVRCAWVLAGAPEPEMPALRWVPGPDKVVVADGGSTLAVKLGIVPDLVTGDFDSMEPGLLSRWQRMGVAFEKYEHHI